MVDVVIKIDEEDYNRIKDMANVFDSLTSRAYKAIRNGKPLPKGHGDLIDRNSILCDDLPCDLCGHTDECFRLLVPTIIEADKEKVRMKDEKAYH